MNIRRWLTGVALASGVLCGLFAMPSTAFAAGFKVPFTDPGQVGSLTLCNPQEKPVTSGSLLSVPFIWRTVSSVPVPSGYTRATLYLYQPIQHIDPGDWTGYQLTDDALFSNKAHPMSQATYADAPLTWPDHSMPPYWSGLYQLRMVFSSPDQQPLTSSYPAAVIKVTGETWTLVEGGGASCTDGTAKSVESYLLPKSKTAVPHGPETQVPYGHRTTAAKKASVSTTTRAGAGGSTTTGSSSGSALADPATSGKSGGASTAAIAGGAVAALVLAGVIALFVVLRRRRVA